MPLASRWAQYNPRPAALADDPELLSAVPAGDRDQVGRLRVGCLQPFLRGLIDPATVMDAAEQAVLGVVQGGTVIRETRLGERWGAQLFGPNQVLHPRATTPGSLRIDTRWSADGTARLLVLDRHFLHATHRWPELWYAVQARIVRQLEIAAELEAILALPRVEQRVLAFLWHLADEIGVVRSDGVHIEFAMTHDLLGQLVGARRPTISLALSTLSDTGLVRRTSDGWILDADSAAVIRLPNVQQPSPLRVV